MLSVPLQRTLVDSDLALGYPKIDKKSTVNYIFVPFDEIQKQILGTLPPGHGPAAKEAFFALSKRRICPPLQVKAKKNASHRQVGRISNRAYTVV